jgi:hypothetical protein
MVFVDVDACPSRPSEDSSRPNSLGHVLRRLEQELANPNVTPLAEFESSIDFES